MGCPHCAGEGSWPVAVAIITGVAILLVMGKIALRHYIMPWLYPDSKDNADTEVNNHEVTDIR